MMQYINAKLQKGIGNQIGGFAIKKKNIATEFNKILENTLV